jgi:AmiR/NasT family two-component response regulator
MFSFSYSGSVRVVLALALGGLFGSTLHAQDMSAKFKEATDLYFRNKPEEALKVFQEVLNANPSNQQAFDMYRECGRQVMALMLVKGGEFEATAKRFLELATLGRKEKTDDPAAIAALVEKVMSGNYLDQRDSLYALSANHGEYGAGPFVEKLADDDKRVVAMDALQHLGTDAVLPLCAACTSENAAVVRYAAVCLGALHDLRALPALKKVSESAADAVNKEAANEAIRRITGKDAGALASANDLHIAAAIQYFRNDQLVVKPYDTPDAVWNVDGNGVKATKVPAALRSLRLAQQHCLAAVEDPRAESVLLAAYAGEKAVAVSAKEMGVEGAAEADPSLDVKIAAGGAPGLSSALQFAIENDAPLAAIQLIGALDAMGAMTPPLTAALDSHYKSVRYQAAFALAAHGETGENVVKVLGEALAEDALRTVLVVDDKSESRNTMAAALREAGYTVITAENGGLGFARARTVPPKDVMVLRANMSDITIDQFVYDADYRSSSSGIVIVSDAAAAEALKTAFDGKGKVKGFLTDPVAAQAVTDAVKAAMPELNHERAAALAAAERAAALLAQLPFNALAPAKDSLVHSLARTEETVLVGALKAVGHLGPADAAAPVAALFADASKSETIRVAAADALGGIFARMTTAPAEDVMKPVMDAASGETNANVRLAAGRALGSANFLTPAQRGQLLKGAAGVTGAAK